MHGRIVKLSLGCPKIRRACAPAIFLWLGTPKSILGTPNWRLGCPIWAIHLLGVPNFSIWGAQLLKMVWKQIFTIPWFRCLNLQLFLKNKKKMSAILNEITKFWPNENYRIVSYKRIFSNGHYGTLGFCVHQAQKFENTEVPTFLITNRLQWIQIYVSYALPWSSCWNAWWIVWYNFFLNTFCPLSP